MRTLSFTAFLLSAGSLAYGQLESDTITIQAARPINLQTSKPDQVVFTIAVNSPLTAGLDDVLAALQGSAITMANLSTLTNSGDDQAPLRWWFSLTIPIDKWKATVASLAALLRSLPKSGMQLSLVQNSQSIAPNQAQSCSPTDLVAGAQVQAQQVAAAAGLFVGPIIAISDASSGAWGTVGVPNFSAARVSLASILVGSWFNTSALPNCVAEVKFKLLRYQ